MAKHLLSLLRRHPFRSLFVLLLVLLIWFVIARIEQPLLHSEVLAALSEDSPETLGELYERLEKQTGDVTSLKASFNAPIVGIPALAQWYRSEALYRDFSFTVWVDKNATADDLEKSCWIEGYQPKVRISQVVLVGCYGDGKLILGIDVTGKAMEFDFFVFADESGKILGWYDSTPYANHPNAYPENSDYMYPQKAAKKACWRAKKLIEQHVQRHGTLPSAISVLMASGSGIADDFELKYFQPPLWSGEIDEKGQFFGSIACEPRPGTLGSPVGIRIYRNQTCSDWQPPEVDR